MSYQSTTDLAISEEPKNYVKKELGSLPKLKTCANISLGLFLGEVRIENNTWLVVDPLLLQRFITLTFWGLVGFIPFKPNKLRVDQVQSCGEEKTP